MIMIVGLSVLSENDNLKSEKDHLNNNSVALTILRLVETTCKMVLCIVIQVELTVKINIEVFTIPYKM